jgi:aldo/keto reductase family protein
VFQKEDRMKTRKLGTTGVDIPAIGLGCMGMSSVYGAADDATSISVIHRAIELGITLLDTADIYGLGGNEELVGRAIKGRRDQVVLATKFGRVNKGTSTADKGYDIDGSPRARAFGGGAGDHPAGARGASDIGARDGVLALDSRPRARVAGADR